MGKRAINPLRVKKNSKESKNSGSRVNQSIRGNTTLDWSVSRVQTVDKDGVINRVKCRREVQHYQYGDLAIIEGDESIILDPEEGRLCAMIAAIRTLPFFIQIKLRIYVWNLINICHLIKTISPSQNVQFHSI